MNIVSSNCISGRVYQQLGDGYTTPFVWNSICLYDFLKLIKNWDTINFKNISIDFSNAPRYGTTKCPVIKLDNLINIYFSHHHFSETETILKNENEEGNTDLYYKNILKYLTDKWMDRLQRMTDRPIFIFDDMYVGDQLYTDVDINEYITLPTPYLKILFTTNHNIVSNGQNLLVFYKDKEHVDSRILGKIIVDNINNNTIKL